MAYKKPLTEGEVNSINVKSVRSWIRANGSKVKARPNKTLLYSGRDYDLEVLKGADGKIVDVKDRETFRGTPMFKRIEKIRIKRAKHNLPVKFETINDVLKKLKSPRIIDKDRIEIRYTHADECFNDLKNKPNLFPKPEVARTWSRLSECFASNASGYIKIMDGAADDYGKLREDKDFIFKELPKLLKNKNLSKKSKDDLKTLISKYGTRFDRRYRELIAGIDDANKVLKGKPK